MKRYFAFTLVELLIAMAVVGIIGALTIPNIQKTYQHKEIIAKINKNIHVLSVTFASMTADNGDIDNIIRTFDTEATRSNTLLKNMYNYTRFAVYCGDSSQDGCFSNTALHTSNNAEFSHFDSPGSQYSGCATAILVDSTNLGICVNKANYDTCAEGYINNNNYDEIDKNCYIANLIFDINGKAGPQYYGVDVFRAELYNDGSVKLSSDIDELIKANKFLSDN